MRNQGMTLSFPPFTPAVKWLLGINTGVYLLTVVLGAAHLAAPLDALLQFGALMPDRVVHGWIWQLVTYAFIHFEFWHWFGNMLAIWMFGSQLEQMWRARRFLELFFFSAIGAALVTVVLSYAKVLGNPHTITYGASGGAFGVLMAFGILFADQEIMLFPLPVQIKAKYFIGILVVVLVIFAIQERGSGIAYLAHLGGLLFGWIYVKYVPRFGLLAGASEGAYGMRNSYFRWKRRRAAKKFQVYMKKQGRDVPYFDEYGNYRGPQVKGKNEDERKGPWVN